MTVTIRKGDCREVLKTLPDQSVHCVVTSPPYWGLRDYGTAQWEGGDPECDHAGGERRCDKPGRNDKQSTHKGTASDRIEWNCIRCGAHRIDNQIGLERSLGEYIETMVGVFREVKRVLRNDGTLWLNMGDCYVTSPPGNKHGTVGSYKNRFDRQLGQGEDRDAIYGDRASRTGLKPKDLAGIPWRVAFALQADGWWLRQDIIWAKPNPMPESVTDRCTKAHEYIFLMSKGARYYYDAEAIKEEGCAPREFYEDTRGDGSGALINGKASRQALGPSGFGANGTRNKRSVWEIATAPFSEAHFATFPPALIEPCIKAGCPKGGAVLDPFGGAGTTGLVADRLGRDAVLIELNPEYIGIAERRLSNDAGMFSNVELG